MRADDEKSFTVHIKNKRRENHTKNSFNELTDTRPFKGERQAARRSTMLRNFNNLLHSSLPFYFTKCYGAV